jgi:hypothetical protein
LKNTTRLLIAQNPADDHKRMVPTLMSLTADLNLLPFNLGGNNLFCDSKIPGQISRLKTLDPKAVFHPKYDLFFQKKASDNWLRGLV